MSLRLDNGERVRTVTLVTGGDSTSLTKREAEDLAAILLYYASELE